MRETIAEIYEMLATRHPAKTLKEQSRQRVLMERAQQVRLNEQMGDGNRNMSLHVLHTRNALGKKG